MRVLFFAQLRLLTGVAECEWPPNGPVDGEDLWRELVARFPALAPHRNFVRLARDEEYVDFAAPLQDAREVALIPPVSGG